MNTKLYRTILIILTVVFLIEGFNGEFAHPTLFDWLKWVAWLFCSAIYFLCVRRNKK